MLGSRRPAPTKSFRERAFWAVAKVGVKANTPTLKTCIRLLAKGFIFNLRFVRGRFRTFESGASPDTDAVFGREVEGVTWLYVVGRVPGVQVAHDAVDAELADAVVVGQNPATLFISGHQTPPHLGACRTERRRHPAIRRALELAETLQTS